MVNEPIKQPIKTATVKSLINKNSKKPTIVVAKFAAKEIKRDFLGETFSRFFIIKDSTIKIPRTAKNKNING